MCVVLGSCTEWCVDNQGWRGPWHLRHQQTDSKPADLAFFSHQVRLESGTTPDSTHEPDVFAHIYSHHHRVVLRHLPQYSHRQMCLKSVCSCLSFVLCTAAALFCCRFTHRAVQMLQSHFCSVSRQRDLIGKFSLFIERELH